MTKYAYVVWDDYDNPYCHTIRGICSTYKDAFSLAEAYNYTRGEVSSKEFIEVFPMDKDIEGWAKWKK